MAELLRRLARQVRPLTEPEAYMAYVRHVRDHGCAAGGGAKGWRASAICADGVQLREQWQRAAAAQDRGTASIRRERTTGGR